MCSPEAGKRSSVRRRLVHAMLLAALVLVLSAPIFAQQIADEGEYDVRRHGPDPLDDIHEALNRYGRMFLWIGAGLVAIIVLKIVNPFRLWHGANDRLLERSVRSVDELLKRIQKEAEETTGSDSEEDEAVIEGGILAGMAEIAEFSQGEKIPSYVTTVNDRMLDNIRITLKRLRPFREGRAQRYRNYMFSVLKGIKTIAEESAAARAPSSLAVDVEDYFQDDRRYKAWSKLLGHARAGGENQEVADSFLLFIRNLKNGRPLAEPRPTSDTLEDTAIAVAIVERAAPEALNEQTLPLIQQAAAKEAESLVAMVRTGTPTDEASAWQFELVQRQTQLHQRQEAQRIMGVFLSCERKAWLRITGCKMLPCRTWSHVCRMLGVETDAALQRRVANRLLTVQEIIILEKAFLQTFAKRRSLERVYGTGDEAELMIDMHAPQIRRESLALLRQSHATEPDRLAQATQALNEAETPQHNEVRRLIEHYVNHRPRPSSHQ